MIVTTDDGNNDNNKTISMKDSCLYFICGIFGDMLPGFFFSSTIILTLDIPDGQLGLPGLCADVGAFFGIVIATLILVKLKPQARVVLNGITQVIGIFLAWFLNYPANVIAGIGLTIAGFVGMLATVLPLSTYAGKTATKSYQMGFAAAPIFGVGIVRIAAAASFDKNGYFSMALAMPILNMISFSCLDHSVWNVLDEDDVGVDDASANKNDICVDLDGDDATKKVTNEEEQSNEYSKSNTPTKSDQVDETAKNTVFFSSSTSMGEDYCRASSNSDEIRSVDLRQIEHDYEKPKKYQGSKKSFAKSIRVTLGSEMRPMTLKDYMLASKEMALTYWALYMVNNLASQFFAIGLYQPTLVASSTSYHGIEGEAGVETSDNILLVNYVGVFLVGLTISTPLGTIFPKMDPHYLWIPVIGLVLLDVIGVIGVAYGAFPPMPVWAVYILSTMIYVLKYFVWLYTPLYVMQDENLTSRYLEFQQQSLFLFVNTPYLLIDILCFVWFQGSILDKCISVYEEVYANTSCTFEIDA